MIDEVFRKNKTTQKFEDADERFLKISLLPDGNKVVDTRSSRLTYVADPRDDKDAINKSWAIKYFKEEKDAITQLGEVANQDLAKAKADLDEAKHLANEATTEVKGIVVDFKDKQEELEALKKNLENLKESLESLENDNVINDTIISTRSTYSSQKVETLLNEKANADDLLGIFSNGKIKAEILPDIDATTLNGKKADVFELKRDSQIKFDALNQSVERVKGSLNQGLNSLSNSLGTKISSNLKGVANGVATLDNLGKIPIEQLPKIDAYTKKESDKKFALKDDLPPLATKNKVGIVKIKNIIDAKEEDVAVTEKAVSDAIEAMKNIVAGTAKLSTNGYIKLPSGLILQWMRATSGGTQLFPITFPNECFFVSATHTALQGSTEAVGIVSTRSFSNSRATFWSSQSGSGAMISGQCLLIFAIGW